MQMNEANATPTSIPPGGNNDLQDHLLTAARDLDRLQKLLANACDALLAGFYGASDQMRSVMETPQLGADEAAFERAIQHLGTAATALQFQDMASQLIAHTHLRLRTCADRIADATGTHIADGADGKDAIALRPNPVTQTEMDPGSVELF
jgi:hypothetical protein